MYLKINGYEISCERGVTWQEACKLLPADKQTPGALGIFVQGRTFSLLDPAEEYAQAHILTYADEEGRRIYERSLQLMFLTAVHRLNPDVHVRIQHSYGRGLYATLREGDMDADFIARVEDEMRSMVEKDLPIERISVTTDDAQDYFARTGQTDRLRILNYRQYPHFTLYHIDGGPEDYFYGEMAPSTGCIGAFALVPYNGGVV